MNRKEFFGTLIGGALARPCQYCHSNSEGERCASCGAAFPEEEPEGQWLTEPFSLSGLEIRAWKYNIESGLKNVLYELGVYGVNVIATYHSPTRRFHVSVSKKGYSRDLLSCYAS